jgi:hypothetical protein
MFISTEFREQSAIKDKWRRFEKRNNEIEIMNVWILSEYISENNFID